MKKIDLMSMSIRNLFRRKFRTFLTVLGVVIGCASIVLMLSLGLAMDKNMEDQMAMFGDVTLIQLWAMGGGEGEIFDEDSIEEISEIENVECVVPSLQGVEFNMTCGKYRTFANVFSIQVLTAEQIEVLGFDITQGRNFKPDEEEAILMGSGVLNYFTKNGKWITDWSNLEPMPFDMETQTLECDILQYDDQTGKPVLESETGKVKKPKSIKVNVVGMLDESNYQTSELVVLTKPLYEKLKEERVKYRKALGYYTDEEKEQDKKETYYNMTVKVDKRENVQGVVDQLNELGYQADSSIEWIDEMKEQSKSRQMALGALGIVSFVVAAIGIANTMMMSIYERTKEIGVMKVIGARLKDIQYMFLMESLLIGLIGGIAGAMISFIISIILNSGGEKIASMMNIYESTTVSIMTPQLLGAGILFSVVIGLISGYFPARKAMKLSALSAIRTE